MCPFAKIVTRECQLHAKLFQGFLLVAVRGRLLWRVYSTFFIPRLNLLGFSALGLVFAFRCYAQSQIRRVEVVLLLRRGLRKGIAPGQVQTTINSTDDPLSSTTYRLLLATTCSSSFPFRPRTDGNVLSSGIDLTTYNTVTRFSHLLSSFRPHLCQLFEAELSRIRNSVAADRSCSL